MLRHIVTRQSIITTQIRHPAVTRSANISSYTVSRHLSSCRRMRAFDAADVEKAIKPNTLLITVMHANNEVALSSPLKRYRNRKTERFMLHTDALIGRKDIRRCRHPWCRSAFTADIKLYAPKGIGVLYIRKASNLTVHARRAGKRKEGRYRKCPGDRRTRQGSELRAATWKETFVMRNQGTGSMTASVKSERCQTDDIRSCAFQTH